MPGPDEVLIAIEAIYAAGVEAELWPQALAAIMRTVGGIAATLEVFGRPDGLLEFHSYGLPPANENKYVNELVALNPRVPYLRFGKPDDLVWDHMVLDERGMNRDPFYAEFLAPAGFRYAICGVLSASATDGVAFSVQRSIKQGHVDRHEIKRMQILLPHVRQAFDMTRRLRGTADMRQSLEHALDWLADGVALVAADGAIVYANDSLQALARRGDGIAIKKGRLEFLNADVHRRFDRALKAVAIAPNGKTPAQTDFPFGRAPGAPSYFLSVRRLPDSDRVRSMKVAPIAIVFIRDSSQQAATAIQMLRDTFGFTEAEAALAQAIQGGMAPLQYARDHAVSANTIYTHLRRIKEKTGSNRLPQLIAKLNNLKVPLRIG